MPYSTFTFKVNPPQFTLGAKTIIIGVDPGQKAILSKPMPAANPGWVAVNAMRGNIANERIRTLELNQTGNPVHLLDPAKTGSFVDAAGHAEKLQQLAHVVTECDGSLGGDMRSFAAKVDSLQHNLSDPKAAEELKRTVKTFGQKQPRFREFSPYGKSADVLEQVRVICDVGRTLEANATNSAISQKFRDGLQVFNNRVSEDANALRSALLDRSETLAALSAFQTHVGDGNSSAYVILTRDVDELLAENSEALAEAIASIKGLAFVDVVFCNTIHGGVAHLHTFAEYLRLRRRASIWATVGDFTEQQAVKFASTNPKRGSFGAASLCLYLGRAQHNGFQVPVSVPVVSNRIHQDQLGAAAMLEPGWGPQASKAIIADATTALDGTIVSDGFETTEWSDQTHKLLAMDSGLNTICRQPTLVASPMFGRSPCKLRGYQFNDSNRVGALLAGNALAWYEQVVPATVNAPEVQRAWCQQAADIFFLPFKGVAGFRGDIKPQRSRQLGVLTVSLRLEMTDPVESIVVEYEQA